MVEMREISGHTVTYVDEEIKDKIIGVHESQEKFIATLWLLHC